MRSRRSFLRAVAAGGAFGVAGCHEETDGSGSGGPGDGQGDGTDGPQGTSSQPGTDDDTGSGDSKESTPAGAGRWPSFQFDQRNGGVGPWTGAPGDGVSQSWQADLDAPVAVQPVLDADRVYVSARDAVYGLDRATGRQRWEFDAADAAPGTPAIDGEYLYVATSRGAFKVNREEGWAAWRFNFTEEFPDILDAVAKSPAVVAGGRMYFHLVVKRRSSSPSVVSRVVALDTRSGNLAWTFDTSRGATVPSSPYTAAPAVAGGRLYFTTGHDKLDSAVYALNAGNGGQVWATGYEGRGHTSPAVVDGSVYVADKFAFGFDAGGGAERFQRKLTPRPNAYGVAVTDDRVLVSSRNFDGAEGTLFGVNTEGRPKWQFSGDSHMYVPTVARGTAYVGNGDGSLYALAVDDGTLRWQTSLGGDGARMTGPVIGADHLYVAASFDSSSGSVYALSTA